MIVLKFGGTSVGNADNIKKVSNIVKAYDQPKIVVLSAVAGTTNSLVSINNYLSSGDREGALIILDELKESYIKLIDALFRSETYIKKAFKFLEDSFNFLQNLIKNDGGNQKVIIAQGEIISTNLFQIYQTEIGNNTKLLSALDFMSLDKFDEPDTETIKARLKGVLEKESGYTTYIT
ncbi:MAG: aspartate kinase, partial [Bacteroidia bacterium]|nr:aspartate kinase [Bacteroidia bacterium]